MDEGQVINKAPGFEGSNYDSWKTRMEAFLMSQSYVVWHDTVHSVVVLNPDNPSTEDKLAMANDANNSVLFCALRQQKFTRVKNCKTAKEMWDSLQAMINDRINNMRALGEDIKDVDVCKKILRSLTSRFNPKVTILEDKDLSRMKIDELQASFTAYEMRIGVPVVHKREAAPKVKEVIEKTETKSKDDLEEDEVANLAKKFKKFRGKVKKKNEGGNYKGRFGRKALISDSDAAPEEDKFEETQEDEGLCMAILKAPQTSVQVEEDSNTEIEKILEECEGIAVKCNQQKSQIKMHNLELLESKQILTKHFKLKLSMLCSVSPTFQSLLKSQVNTQWSTFNRRDFGTSAIRNFKITRMYVKKSDLASAQKVKDKGSLVKTKMMWIPKKLNSVSLLVYTAFKACNIQDKWYVDSGCSRHMTGDGSKFNSLKQFDGGNVIFGDNQRAKIVRIGTVSKSEELPEIQEVLLVERLKHNLLNVSQLCDNGKEVYFNKERCNVIDLELKQVLFSANRSSGNVHTVTEASQVTQCNLTTCDEAKLWHKRLSHLHLRNMSKILKLKAVKGLPNISFKDDHLCKACQQGKQTKVSFPSKEINTSTSDVA
ncbi:uncharacterized protein LOC132280927 [Cornus florida]|uniref:uncharacterized protein LOC132280927 n=1 Tax=Cornus florida TaxID=4283 RepID=UPI00289A327B|nr:uncharacterized protein LOC132280927 [Cornus florida]